MGFALRSSENTVYPYFIRERENNMSFDRMIEKIVETQNPTVAGLDPKLSYIPQYILE